MNEKESREIINRACDKNCPDSWFGQGWANGYLEAIEKADRVMGEIKFALSGIDKDFPTIDERLGWMISARQIIQHSRKKIAEWEKEK